MGIKFELSKRDDLYNQVFYEKYETELIYLFAAKIMRRDSWDTAKCSECIKTVGNIIFSAADPKLIPFKQMFFDPLTYLHRDSLTPEGLVVTITDNFTSITLKLTLNKFPNFSTFGINNVMCKFPGKEDSVNKEVNYLKWAMEQFMSTDEYLNMVDIEIVELKFN